METVLKVRLELPEPSHLRFWDAWTGEPLGPARPFDVGHSGPLRALFRDDGQRLVLLPSGAQIDLRPESRPIADLISLAQLLSGYRIEFPGQRRPLSESDVIRLWREASQKFPEAFKGARQPQ